MVLTDREIQAAIQNQQILVDPSPSETAYSSTSLDLSLSRFLRSWKVARVPGVEQTTVSPATPGYTFSDFANEYSELITMPDDGYIVEPQAFVLGWTEESVKLPTFARVAARIEGKSSLSRLGIGVHVTAPTIHAGFDGQIQFEICNHGMLRVKLVPGMPVCQLIFEQTLGTPAKGYAGQFLGQKKK